MERAKDKSSSEALSVFNATKHFFTMTQNPTDIRIRLGIAQTLCIFLYEKDMEKSIQGEGPLWTEPPIHTQYSFITQGQIIYYSTFRERENMGVIL